MLLPASNMLRVICGNTPRVPMARMCYMYMCDAIPTYCFAFP
jgi:hypothetical protein